MLDRVRHWGLAVVVLALPMAQEPPTSETPDGPVVSGPIVTTTVTEAPVGARVPLTFDGFLSPFVTISVCGNEARRGSVDCNMSTSEGTEISGSRPGYYQMHIDTPPADCPCVIRVVGKDASEVALTPIVITGHPVSPPVDAPHLGQLVAVSVNARKTPNGIPDALRSDLGGRTTYEVTVRVKNITTTPLSHVQISASAGHGKSDDSLVSIDIDDPGLIGVGQTWQQIVSVEIPAPVFGKTEWRAVVSGAGPVVTARSVTKHRPWLLMALVMLVLFNGWLLFVRWRTRCRERRAATVPDEADLGTIDGPSGSERAPVEPASADSLVGLPS